MNTQPQPFSADEEKRLAIRLLGRFEVSVGAQVIADRQWRLRKSRHLIKLLALAPQHRLHREQVLDTLWPNLPADEAAHNLHQVLYIARRALDPAGGGAQYLPLQDEALSLGPDSGLWIDAEAFEAAGWKARQMRTAAAYRAALDLYAGDLLPDDRYEEWAALRRDTLHQTYLALLVELADLYEERSEYAAGIEMATRALASEPALEAAHRSLMRLYARSGRPQQALRQYQLLKESLQREIDAEPDAESERLYRQILAAEFPPAPGEPRRGGRPEPQLDGLPAHPALRLLPSTRQTHAAPPEPKPVRNNLLIAVNSFIGRESAMADIKRLLASSRLVTLTGSGGCGKTRLALQVAADAMGTFSDGVWFVDLAPLSDPSLVPQRVASTLDVRERPEQPLLSTLIDYLRNKQMLMVFDNCEHLISACAQLAESLLRTCADLRILATSREALRIAGETNYRVPSLTAPPVSVELRVMGPEYGAATSKTQHSVLSPQNLAKYEAMRLFIDRAEAANVRFRLTSSNAPAVARICIQLDGMPLAIELAAACVTSLSAEQITERLEDRFRLLTGGSRTAVRRHQTLHAAIEWSYDLLTEPERILLRRLSVFAGGWTLEAAEKVCQDVGQDGILPHDGQDAILSYDVLEVLARLVDKSLVNMEEEAGAIRYRMLETIRQYAMDKLRETGEPEGMRDAQLVFFMRMAEEAEHKLLSGERGPWLQRLAVEHDNLRAALTHSQADATRAEFGLRLASSLYMFWYFGRWTEAYRWLELLLARSNLAAHSATKAKALWCLGALGFDRGDFSAARTRLEASIAIFRELLDNWGLAHALRELGLVARDYHDHPVAHAALEESVAIFREIKDSWGLALSLVSLGRAMLMFGDHAAARLLLEESLAVFRAMGDEWGTGLASANLGLAAFRQADYDQAATLYKESIAILWKVNEKLFTVRTLDELARLRYLQEDYVRATRLLAIVEAFRQEIGAAMGPADRSEHDHAVAAVRARMDDTTFAQNWDEGRALTLEQAIAEATRVNVSERAESSTSTQTLTPTYSTVLTAREVEVLRLMAQGLTNAQIAETLAVSPRTVSSHLQSIFSKMDVTTRTAAVRVAIEHKIV